MPYEITLTDLAFREIESIAVYYRREIVDQIKVQLVQQPTVPTRNRKSLEGTIPGFEHVAPIWALRVREYRVFYDVDEERHTVNVRAVRRKQAGQTIEEIIR